jgi:predicted TPR repeat methyltransferase
LAVTLRKTGDHAGAANAWRKVLTLSPTDIFGASLKLSLTGQAETPSAPPKEYVEALFDGYSDRFDTALLEDLGYRVPERPDGSARRGCRQGDPVTPG